MITGAQLRRERELVGVLASTIAEVWGVDAAILTRLEQREDIDPARARHYRRTVAALAKQRKLARRQLIEELSRR